MDVRSPVRLEVLVPIDFRYYVSSYRVDRESWLPQYLTRLNDTEEYEEGRYSRISRTMKKDVFIFQFSKAIPASSVSYDYFQNVVKSEAPCIDTKSIVTLDMEEIHLFMFYSGKEVEQRVAKLRQQQLQQEAQLRQQLRQVLLDIQTAWKEGRVSSLIDQQDDNGRTRRGNG